LNCQNFKIVKKDIVAILSKLIKCKTFIKLENQLNKTRNKNAEMFGGMIILEAEKQTKTALQ
jgi:hypothetical protein